MKAQNKNRKQPTCSRCRNHGKADVRILQHQCPFKSCTCDSCILVKRRSIIYRAQKNLDRQDDNSNERPSSPSSASTVSSSGGGCIGSPHIVPGSQSSIILAATNGESAFNMQPTSTNCPGRTHHGGSSWASSMPHMPTCAQTPQQQHNHNASQQQPLAHYGYASEAPSVAYSSHQRDPKKIGDFQTLCLSFPDYSPSQLQTLFEQSGSDFQRTIDRILMSKWYSNGSVGDVDPRNVHSNGFKHENDRISTFENGYVSTQYSHYNTDYGAPECNSGQNAPNIPYHCASTYPGSNSACDWRSRIPDNNHYNNHDSYRSVASTSSYESPVNAYEIKKETSGDWRQSCVTDSSSAQSVDNSYNSSGDQFYWSYNNSGFENTNSTGQLINHCDEASYENDWSNCYPNLTENEEISDYNGTTTNSEDSDNNHGPGKSNEQIELTSS